MLLKNKNALIYGAGGAIGGAVARTFASEGQGVSEGPARQESVNSLPNEDVVPLLEAMGLRNIKKYE